MGEEQASAPHFDAATFRRRGYEVVDWVAGYLERVETLPVRAQVEPGWVRAQLPAHPPQEGESFDELLADLDRVVLPGLTHWQHPGFFAYFPANASGPAVLADLVASGLGVQGMLWATSPAATELESHVLDWLVELLGLPAAFRSDGPGGGVIQDAASSATLCALLAARERATTGTATAAGVDRTLTVYCSEQAHSSVEKAVRIAGHGTDALRLVDSDDRQRLRVDRLSEMVALDAAAGATPCLVVATVGTTSAGAVDPVADIAAVARSYGAWTHVDAAWAGSAAVCPEHRWLHTGLDDVDSYCVNPHKWLLTNFDCDAFYVADRQTLVRALSVLPEYLRNAATDSGAVIDYRDWQVPLGRRFRALKLWWVLRHYGADGLRAHIRNHVALAQRFAEWVAADDAYELAAEPSLALVCFRHRAGDGATQRVLDAVNARGRVHLSHTRIDGTLALRLAVGAPATTSRHLQLAWSELHDVLDDEGTSR